MHPNTFDSFIPQNLVSKKATTKTRREIIEDLLSNDPRSKSQQVWTLEKKEKKKKRKKKEDNNQDAGLVEKYKMRMKLPSPLNDFMSLMNRISFQKRCFLFSEATMRHKQDTTLDQFKTTE